MIKYTDVRPDAIDASKLGTDLANAEAFAKWTSKRLLYVYGDRPIPHLFDGVGFQPCTKAEDVALAARFAKDCAIAASKVQGEDARQSALKAAQRLHGHKTIQNLLGCARALPVLTASEDDFNVNPLQFGVMNGVLDLEHRKLLAPDPSLRVSFRSTTIFDPSAKCRRFIKYLEGVLPDPDVRTFLQQAIGYTLSGLVTEDLMLFLTGDGANGKTVLTDLMTKLMGDYTHTLNRSTITKRRFETDESLRDIVKLRSKRLAFASELSTGERWNDGALKALIQTSRIKGRDLYKAAVEFQPTHKIWIASNAEPILDDQSNGLIRRIAKINFPRTFTPEERDPDLGRKLELELPGVLNWAVEGFRQYRSVGRLVLPKSVAAATEAYRRNNDSIAQWLESETKPQKGSKLPLKDAQESYERFCRGEGLEPLTNTLFGKRLEAMGFPKGRKSNLRFYEGLSLNTLDFDDV